MAGFPFAGGQENNVPFSSVLVSDVLKIRDEEDTY